MFGREGRLPADVMFRLPSSPMHVNKYAQGMRFRMEQAYQLVRDRLQLQVNSDVRRLYMTERQMDHCMQLVITCCSIVQLCQKGSRRSFIATGRARRCGRESTL